MHQFWRFWPHWLQLGFLAGLLGWALADYQLPVWACWITLGLMAHLARAGADAIFLTVVWLIIWLWVAAFRFSWPLSLQPPGWSSLVVLTWVVYLVVLWLIAAGLIWRLVLARRSLRQAAYNPVLTCHILLALTWASFGLGWIINRSGWIPLSSP